MYCKKCGKEIPKDSLFCSFCGYKIEDSLSEKKENKDKEGPIKKPLKKSKKLIVGILVLVIIAASTVIYSFSSNPINSVIKALENENYEEARKVYREEVIGDDEAKESISEKLLVNIDEIVESFKAKEITDEESIDKLDGIAKIGILKMETTEAKREVSNLAESRVKYASALKLEESGDYVNALADFNKVIETDRENYSNAQAKIKDLSEVYKENILLQIEELGKGEKYKDALSLINEALRIIPKDSDLEAKKTSYTELEKEQKEIVRAKEIEKAKSEQIIIVEGTKILVQSADYKALYPDMFEVIFKNNSGKTIESYEVSMLGWDKKGYPLKIKQNFLDNSGSYEFRGSADNVNVVDGATYGKNYGWQLQENHNIVTTKAVVKEASFYDGSTWTNPYYRHFMNEYRGEVIDE